MYFYSNKDQLWSCGGWIRWWSGHVGGMTDIGQLRSEATDVDYLPGACILVRNSALGKIGLMSEEYFLAYEETDWAIQARKASFRVVACAKSVLFHRVGVSSRFTPELTYNSFRNRFLFFRRQFRAPLSWFLTVCVLASGLRKNSLARRLCWRAFKDHFKYRHIRRSHLDAVRVGMKICMWEIEDASLARISHSIREFSLRSHIIHDALQVGFTTPKAKNLLCPGVEFLAGRRGIHDLALPVL